MNDVIVQPDGKFIGFGAGYTPNGTVGLAVSRYLTSGAPDATFGTNGAVVTIFNTSSNLNQAQALTGFLQTDGKIVAAGLETIITPFNVNVAVARYSNSPGNVPTNNPALPFADFDGDGKSDASVFRAGTWYINPSSNPTSFAPSGFYGVQFGLAADKLAPADYDGDGKTDIAVWRESANAYFYILQSATNTVRTEKFGQTGDVVTVGDWDGDGKADPATFRDGAQSYFFYRGSLNNPNGAITYLPWGTSGDKAVRGDFDGDGKFDAAVYRPANQTWYIRRSSDGQSAAYNFGAAADERVSGDFDGDGKSDIAVFRSGAWYVMQSSNNQIRFQNWGAAGDVPTAGDFDGDGKTDFAVFRGGVFYILSSGAGTSTAQSFGAAGDVPAFLRNP